MIPSASGMTGREEVLPVPTPAAQVTSHALCARIVERIHANAGWLPFVDYMEMALHLPGLGYYAGGAQKFGDLHAGGDFVTAPELTPLFGQALARQIAQVLDAVPPAPTFPATVLEVGAGSGRLAADILPALETLGCLPQRYAILELSGELRARQQQTLAAVVPHLADRVVWLDALPEKFSGCVIANELLDALPTHAVAWRSGNTGGRMERGVTLAASGFAWAERPATGALAQAMALLPVTAPYESEVGLAARAWVAEWGHRLVQGALLLIDYGLPRHELYHPQRSRGTLRCHYRQRAHDDPFWWPGISDITSHIDFTAIAEAGFDSGLDVLGYASQASFLINCGIGELLTARQQAGGAQSVRASGALQTLIAPGEMGELFKVIALGRGVSPPLLGFMRGDRRHTL
jgi:SAM-dependent MidA family methyltransferase